MPSNVTGIAVGVSLGLVALLAIVIFWFLRHRHRQLRVITPQAHRSFRWNTLLDPSHPACHVTPFGSPGSDIPRFVHQPGVNMRLAYMRSDGGWEFSELTPDNVSLLNYAPARVSLSARSTLSFAPKDKLKLHAGELTTRGYVEPDSDVDENPPPAYCRTDACSPSEV